MQETTTDVPGDDATMRNGSEGARTYEGLGILMRFHAFPPRCRTSTA